MDLNPQLCAALKRKFNGHVQIANEGIKNEWRITYNGRIKERELISRGQNFRVNCPYCNDTRQRLYISYEWGVTDTLTGHTNLNLVNCYNESCFAHVPERKSILFFEVLFGRPVLKAFLKQGTTRVAGEYVAPGFCVPLHKLNPGHIAIQYLRNERNFDINILSHSYGVKWCDYSDLSTARSRIIIPVIENKKEISWMARLPYKREFVNEQGQKIPKYYNMPGSKTERYLFNYDSAKQYKTVILVEGAFDCINIGPPAIGLMGKSISPYNLDRLISHVSRNNILIVIALDPDKALADRQSKHHIEVTADKIRRQYTKVMPFYLPSNTDPGGISRDLFKQLLFQSANEQNVELDFSKI